MKPLTDSILFCRQDRLGDVVLSLPLAAAVKKINPEIKVGFLVNDGIGEVVQACNEVDVVWEVSPETKLDKDLLREWSVAVVLWPHPKLARRLFFAGVSRRIGTGRRGYSIFFNERVAVRRHASGRHETELNFDLLDQVFRADRTVRPTFLLDPDNLKTMAERLESAGVAHNMKIAVLHPGSGGSSRDWPLEHFEMVAETLSKRSDTFVVVTGNQRERKLAIQIAKTNPKKILMLAGETSLTELMSLLSFARITIANSTGPLHLANALGCPTFGLFPPLIDCGPERWGVLDHPERSLVPEFPEEDCPFCKEKTCPKGECMRLLSVERVLDVAEPFIDSATVSWHQEYVRRCAGL